MAAASTPCDNPMCTCPGCTCETCRCGGAKLGELERRVMDVLWDAKQPDMTGRHVADLLPQYAYTTVATVLDRLTRKGLVRRTGAARTIRFAPTDTRAAHTAMAMHQALNAAGDAGGALARFAATMSGEQVAALRHALHEL